MMRPHLWAITRLADSIADTDHIAAPSSEAALAFCADERDSVSVFLLTPEIHADWVVDFLDCWEPTREQMQ